MRYLRFMLLPLLFGACDNQPVAPDLDVRPDFSANSAWQEFTIDVEWTLYNPCLQENLHGTGQSFVRRHTVITAGETRYTFHVRPVEGTWQMEGLTTGHIWLPTPGSFHTLSMRTVPRTFEALYEHWVFQNQTTGQVLDWSLGIHYVTNANGEVKVNRIVPDRCDLRH